MVGKAISHYRIIDKLGQGGMGEVYRAEDRNLHYHVAIKVLPDEFAQDHERLARFQREALWPPSTIKTSLLSTASKSPAGYASVSWSWSWARSL